jgi:hypothetical protein
MVMFEQLAAETYRQMGFPIQTLESDKSPLGIITYPSWGAGFFVVDVDAHYGGLDSFKKLNKRIEFPKTVTAKTPRGGLHLYYKYPDGVKIPWRVDTKSGIDILADDSLVHMPPSKSKMPGKKYNWIISPQTTEMAYPSKSMLQYIGAIQS